MRKSATLMRGAAWLTGGAVVAISGQAAGQAATPCPTGASTVFLSGSSAFQPVLQATAKALGATVSLVYQKPGSCEGLQHLLGDGAAMPMPDTDAAVVFPADGTAPTACALPRTPAEATVDIGISDVYASTCASTFDTALNPLGAAQKDFLGPIQAMTFAVPTMSSANNISAEAAYMVFRFDASDIAHTIAPWTTATDIYVRFWDSGTLEMIGSAINLPGGNWKNATSMSPAPPQQTTGAGNMVTKITGAATAGDVNGTIGILGAANIYGTTGIKPLAFQATGESCAFYPDSSSSAADKLNVRQGRYTIWGPEHLVVNVDAGGNPVGQNMNTQAVQTVISSLTATMTGPTMATVAGGSALTDAAVGNIIDLISKPGSSGGVVPWCAMEVGRTKEIGALASYQSPYPCVCRYEAAVAATVHAHACTMCTSDADCAGDAGSTFTHCRYGYCEAK